MARKLLHDDLFFQQFGRLTAIAIAPRELWKTSGVHWICECDCGGLSIVTGYELRRGSKGTRSCGCLKAESSAKNGRDFNLNHGHTAGGTTSRTWNSWHSMKQRCLEPERKEYPVYGGRGISICEQWINSFEVFLADMGERPAGKTLDRIDVNGNYEPGNCRWATSQEQAQNRRDLPITDETRAKMSVAGKGRPKSPEHRAKISAALKGRKPSEACLQAVSKSNRRRSK